jgi:hypothetical protein
MHHIIVTELIKSEVTLREANAPDVHTPMPFQSLWRKVQRGFTAQRATAVRRDHSQAVTCQAACAGQCVC